MSTQISDLIVPSVFAKYMLEDTLKANALINSGIIMQNPALSAALSAGGLTFNFPSFRNIDEDTTAANVSSSNASTRAAIESQIARKQTAVRLERNRVYGAGDLAASVAGADPMAAVSAYLGGRLAVDRQKALMSTLAGVMGAVTANVNDTTTATFSSGELIDTLGAFGDRANNMQVVLLMNSATYRARQKEQATALIVASDTPIGFKSYLGMPVLIDDTVPAGQVYVLENGAIEFGASQHKHAVAVDRDELGGNGGGAEIIVARDIYAFHVSGTRFVGTPAGELPTDAELATAGNWNAVFSPKAIGVALYKFTA